MLNSVSVLSLNATVFSAEGGAPCKRNLPFVLLEKQA